MASLSDERKSDSCWKVYFVLSGRRNHVRLSKKLPKGEAEKIRAHIESLERSLSHGAVVPVGTMDWLGRIDDRFYDTLARKGLVSERQDWPILDWMDHCIGSWSADVKVSTTIVWRQARRGAGEYFTSNPLVQEIDEAMAEGFYTYLMDDQKLAKATSRKRCSVVKRVLTEAVDQGLIDRNPFRRIRTASPRSEVKESIPADIADLIDDKLPDANWRLIFSLARYGGLRVPSEPLGLTWDDIDFKGGKITVRSPKTEHHPGGAQRTIPMFDQIRQPLLEVRMKAGPNEVYVLPWLQEVTPTALRKPLMAAVKRAGVKQWKKLWVTLRANADQDLRRAGVPDSIVNQWIGHSTKIAEKYYQSEIETKQYEVAIDKMRQDRSAVEAA